MNKILLSSGNFDLERYTSPCVLEVKGKTTLNAINICTDLTLDVHILDGAEFILNLFDIDETTKHKIHLTAFNNSKVTVNASFIAIDNYDLEIDATINGASSTTDVNIRGINESSDVNIILNGNASAKAKNSIINEYAKIINASDKSNTLVPNLIVNTNEVVANHGVSIGLINDEELFYLMSKGITKASAIKLIEEGFILSIMDGEVREKIKNVLLGR